MRTFGASAPLKELVKKFGFTPEHVVAAARSSSRCSGTWEGNRSCTVTDMLVQAEETGMAMAILTLPTWFC